MKWSGVLGVGCGVSGVGRGEADAFVAALAYAPRSLGCMSIKERISESPIPWKMGEMGELGEHVET